MKESDTASFSLFSWSLEPCVCGDSNIFEKYCHAGSSSNMRSTAARHYNHLVSTNLRNLCSSIFIKASWVVYWKYEGVKKIRSPTMFITLEQFYGKRKLWQSFLNIISIIRRSYVKRSYMKWWLPSSIWTINVPLGLLQWSQSYFSYLTRVLRLQRLVSLPFPSEKFHRTPYWDNLCFACFARSSGLSQLLPLMRQSLNTRMILP